MYKKFEQMKEKKIKGYWYYSEQTSLPNTQTKLTDPFNVYNVKREGYLDPQKKLNSTIQKNKII